MDYPGKVITKNQVTPTQTSATGVWTLDDAAAAVKNNNWPVALVPNPISKSLRFNSADSAYLNRTPATASNRKTWTWSGWVKRSGLAASTQSLFARNDASVASYIVWNSNQKLEFTSVSAGIELQIITTPVYRDVSSWYHVVVALDTTQATSSNRVKIYVNGVQVTALDTATYPSLNYDAYVNTTNTHYIGNGNPAGSLGWYSNQYLTEINFIDGQALTPSSFGMTNPQTGQWIPLKYSGTYGTNGFYLNFKDATSTTTLGLDYSGNANNWTTNNFSVTAGSGNDSLTDVPTPWVAYNTTGDVGGVIRGNYATLNPLYKGYGGFTAAITPTNGNLDQLGTTTGNNCIATQALAGKTYFEMTVTASSGGSFYPGIINESGSVRYYDNNGTYYNGSSSSAYGASFTTNDIIGVAVDNDALSITFYKNGTSQGTKTSAFTSGTWFPFFYTSNTQAVTANFGQRPFAYTPPTGFRSLCTTNLPATAIGFGLTNQGDDYFNAVLYTGDGTANRSVTGVGFQPDLVWAKARSAAYYNGLFDNLRSGRALYSNATDAEDTTEVVAFGSDGFTTPNKTGDFINTNSATYVAWNWKAGGTGVTNTAGTITSTVSANTTAGFSVVTYTGTGSNATVGHGLSVAPSMIIVKDRSAATNWIVGHTSIAWTNRLQLNTTGASTAASTTWNDTAPTSTVFSIGTSTQTNANTNNHVAYCFAAVPGYSAFGSYNSNASSDGPFIYTGFRPRFVMIKKATGSVNANAGWYMFDTARGTYNVIGPYVQANLSDAETTGSIIDTLSNGFKLRIVDISVNGSTAGDTYIYMAFAESPFQFANAR